MNDEIREQLSALADDELNELERPLLLGRMQRDSLLRECLGRYQLIGEVMRGAGASAGLGVAKRVQQAMESDTPMKAPHKTYWWKPFAGLAVAASVALVAVLAVTTVRNDDAGEPVVAVTETTPDTTLASEDPQLRWNRIEPQVEKRLSGYLVNHSEYAASRGFQGVMPYARVVSDTHP
ncbi:RseA-like anti sigma(E) protein [Thiogranum longum]|uniref:RseA-like anti sigma(E) protein n=1 Tax=Thiogranum longum TaxID=1537524 RepID=A0A4R1HAQ0_9GAMM|nr:sigma-E factor negative regulatory protein [Thiogranum longum]TCK17573.1 RseA-like anti sigma(E) protein [Thiogranum longum]